MQLGPIVRDVLVFFVRQLLAQVQALEEVGGHGFLPSNNGDCLCSVNLGMYSIVGMS